MKIRSDFVTNSSSSSFIALFKDRADFESCYTYIMNERDERTADTVYDDLEEGMCDRKRVYAEVYEKCFDEAQEEVIFTEDFYKLGKDEYSAKYNYVEQVEKARVLAEKRANEIMAEIPDGMYSIVYYDCEPLASWVSKMKFVCKTISWRS